MKTQVLKMIYNGVWTVTFDDAKKVNPYTIHYNYNALSAHGLQKHRKKVTEYADFKSCTCYLNDRIKAGDTHGRNAG